MSKICIDFHGVLSDGRLNLTQDGSILFESMSVRDTSAIREFVARGFEVYIVTQSSNKIIDAYCQKVGVKKIVLRDKRHLNFEYDYAVGDSMADLHMLNNAKIAAYCPSDADMTILAMPKVRKLATKGGNGVIGELCRLLLYNDVQDSNFDHIEQ